MQRLSLLFTIAFSLLAFTTSNALAVSSFSVKGKVLDPNGQPLFAATVALLNAKDSSLAKVTATEADGTFDLEVPSGNYLLKVSVVGFDAYSSLVNVANNNVSLPEIKLSSSSVNLKEVTVTADKPMIEVKPDKTVSM